MSDLQYIWDRLNDIDDQCLSDNGDFGQIRMDIRDLLDHVGGLL